MLRVPSSSCARSPPSSSDPCCCSPAARTRSCCCASPRRRSGRRSFPFPIMHIDTGHNFPEVLEFRDRRVAELGERLIVASVQESIDKGRVREETRATRRATGCRRRPCSTPSRSTSSTRSSVAAGATRRRRAPRSASSRCATSSASGSPQPAARAVEPLQRAHPQGPAHARLPDQQLDRDGRLAVHRARGLEVPSIYFAHERDVFRRDGMWPDRHPFLPPRATASRSSGWSSATGPWAT